MTNPESDAASLGDWLRSAPFYALPHHALSRIMHAIMRVRVPAIRDAQIHWFMRRFNVDLSQATQTDIRSYPDFNSFFTRALRDDARPLPNDPQALCCPVDGAISQIGHIDGERVLQAKGRDYSAVELLGGDAERARPFQDGLFTTLYLSPRDYHRIHLPIAGKLREMVYVPGRLFSVAPHTTRAIPGLFARNERVVALFDTEAGPLAVVMVGAIFVASIETVWAGVVTPPARARIELTRYPSGQHVFTRGAEIGRFNMGSTVILLGARDAWQWQADLRAGQPVRMGQTLATR